ncbi:hypothetical protein JCM19235_6005 [Vibrio maritimus]|uniref:Uncharacterized protein n=1 Tax=Vibrio maritimus TaxID=990268 RepID=A0A090RQD1_9VIBR|nr:hypothetical protein JCM19235_6005 [Vibrio maritimus]
MPYQQKVWPDNGAREGRYILLAIALLIAFAFVAIPINQRASTDIVLKSYQVRADQLTTRQQTLVSQLKVSHEEIFDLHLELKDEGTMTVWPSILELKDLYLAPFTEDLNWQNLASISWNGLENGYYSGEMTTPELSLAQVLVNSQNEDSPVIWLHTDAQELPTNINDDLLLKQGWKQVVFVQTHRQAHSH